MLDCHLVLAKCHVEESHPGGVVRGVQALVVHRLHDEVEGLREPEEEDDVDDREGEHVSRDHGEDHGDKGPGQLDRPEKQGLCGLKIQTPTLQRRAGRTSNQEQQRPKVTPQ